MGSCSGIFKASIAQSFFSPGVLYSGAVLFTCRDETLSGSHRANPNRQFHSLLCFFSCSPSLTHSLTFPHTLTLSLQHSHKPSVFLTHSFQFTMTAVWILSGFPQFPLFLQRSLNDASYGAAQKRLTVTSRICTKIILEGQTCKNLINSSSSAHQPQFVCRRTVFILWETVKKQNLTLAL